MTVDEKMDTLNPEHERRMAAIPITNTVARHAEIDRHYAARRVVMDAHYRGGFAWGIVAIVLWFGFVAWRAHVADVRANECRSTCVPSVGVVLDAACFCLTPRVTP